jgi:hypothetical protein
MASKELEEKRAYRLQLFVDSFAREKRPDRIPHTSAFITWQILDAGYKLSEALFNYDIMRKCIIEHCEKYEWDGISSYGTRNPLQVTTTLGTQYYRVDDEAETISIDAYELLGHDELREFAKDPTKFLWEVCMPRKHPLFNSEMTKETFQKTIDENVKFNNYSMGVMREVNERFAYPASSSPFIGFPYMGNEYLFSMLRGIKGFSLSMRRDIEALGDAADALDKLNFWNVYKNLQGRPVGREPGCTSDASLMFLSHVVMNRKQWEYLYWNRTIKPFIDEAAAKKKNINIMFEGIGGRFYDYFADYPKGTVAISMEQDDIFEAKKKYPQLAFIGGMPSITLGRGTKQEVLDLAKKLINEVGYDGGYVMSLDKMGSNRQDGNPENVKALCDYMQVQD